MNQNFRSPVADPFLSGYSPYSPPTPLSPPQSYFEQKAAGHSYHSIDVQDTYQSTPLDSSSRRRSSIQVTRRVIYKLWLVELLATCVSVVVLAILFGILKAFNLRPVADHGLFSGLPTTLVNAFTTLMRTAMLLPVATALAQLQWSWFQTERDLLDIETFDDATRGVLGSFVLLTKMGKGRFWHLAAVGALLTIASLALETVVGSAIYITVKGAPLPEPVLVPRTNRYSWALDETTGRALGDQVPIPAMIAAIDSGLSQGTGYGDIERASQALLSPACDSGYCDFGIYQTIAVDHICSNITSMIESNSVYHAIPSHSALQEPLLFDIETARINSTVSFLYPDSSYFQNASQVGPLIANVFVMANLKTGQVPVAVECVLYWSVWTLDSFTTPSSSWNETFLKSETNSSSAAQHATLDPATDQEWIYIDPEECWINNTQYTDHTSAQDPVDKSPECIHFVTPKAQLGLMNWFANPAYGLIGSKTYDSVKNTWADTNPFTTYLGALLDLENDILVVPDDIDQYVFNNLALTMTETIRYLPRGSLENGPGSYNCSARGVMFDSMRFHVHWPIMIFPTVLVFGSALFTFIVARQARQHLWKKSNLPLLFHGLGTRERDSCGEIEDYVDMRTKARDMKVKLLTTEDGHVRFVQVR